LAEVHLVHHQEGAHELIEISPVMHWLRDASLALPLIFLAAWPAMRLIRRQVEQRDWKTRPWLTALVEMAAIALLASAFITAANPLHSWLFQASHEHEVSLTRHLVRDGLISLSIYLLLAGIFVLIWPAAPRPEATAKARPRLVVAGSMLSIALVLNFLLLSPFGAMLQLMPLNAVANQHCITADIVALDQPFYYNRLGAIQANGMMYALARDVVINGPGNLPVSSVLPEARAGLEGNVSLRSDKRPRPIVLRVNEGDCLDITFTNLLHPDQFIFNLPGDFPTGQIRPAPHPPGLDPYRRHVPGG